MFRLLPVGRWVSLMLVAGFNRPMGVAGRGVPDPSVPRTEAVVAPIAPATIPDFSFVPHDPQEPQGQLGSCGPHGASLMWESAALSFKSRHVDLSRLFLYWIGREPRGWTQQDSGVIIPDLFAAMTTVGVCPESQWPYQIDQYRTKPPQDCFDAAARNRMALYSEVRDLAAMKTALASKVCVGFAFIVFAGSIENAGATGEWSRPPSDSYYGAHFVCLVGYDDDHACPGYSPGAGLVANSWSRWGVPHPDQPNFSANRDSYFWMPYEALFDERVCFDLFCIHKFDLEVA